MPRAFARAATRRLIIGWKTTSRQPSPISTGTIAWKAAAGSTSSSTAPVTPPRTDAAPSRTSRGRWPTSSRR